MKNFGEYSAESAMDFIEAWEGCRLQAYKCPAGIWTIGVGHTKDVTEHDEITYERRGRCFVRTSRRSNEGLRLSSMFT